jgi:L-alanine-DL-glutamate epimerase-like enolase superfamily enzyme
LKVTTIEVFKGRLDLVKPFRISYGEWSSVETIYVKSTLDDGSIGWGEAPPAPEITGDTSGTIVEAIKYLKDVVKDVEIDDLRSLNNLLRKKLKGNSAAIAGLINSIADALSRSAGVPLVKLLGGIPCKEPKVITDVTVGLDRPENMAKEALKWVEKGFNIIKVKLGGRDDLDVERVKSIRDVVGDDVIIRVDANQAWSPKEAVKIGKSLERLDVEMIEQPVDAKNLLGLKYVKDNLGIPIVADESVHDSYDLKELVRLNAVDGINIKLSKSGGVIEALKMVEIAKTFNLELMIGCMIESSLGLATASHLVAATNAFKYVDLDSDLDLKDQPLKRGLKRERNLIILDPSLPGVGVEPDENKLERLLKLDLS